MENSASEEDSVVQVARMLILGAMLHPFPGLPYVSNSLPSQSCLYVARSCASLQEW